MEAICGKFKKRRGIWGISGTAFSAIGFIGLALFEQYNSVLSEFRADLKHFNETSSEYVKRESFQRFREHFRESMKELHEAELTRMRLEQELKASEKRARGWPWSCAKCARTSPSSTAGKAPRREPSTSSCPMPIVPLR